MDDLISRQAAIDMCRKPRMRNADCSDFEMEIMMLPPAQPHWIPCSERLPKVKQKVLVQYADGSMATKRCNDAGHLAWFYSNAVAWMPAPEPYKGVTE